MASQPPHPSVERPQRQQHGDQNSSSLNTDLFNRHRASPATAATGLAPGNSDGIPRSSPTEYALFKAREETDRGLARQHHESDVVRRKHEAEIVEVRREQSVLEKASAISNLGCATRIKVVLCCCWEEWGVGGGSDYCSGIWHRASQQWPHVCYHFGAKALLRSGTVPLSSGRMCAITLPPVCYH
jgi:hypothetical protein